MPRGRLSVMATFFPALVEGHRLTNIVALKQDTTKVQPSLDDGYCTARCESRLEFKVCKICKLFQKLEPIIGFPDNALDG